MYHKTYDVLSEADRRPRPDRHDLRPVGRHGTAAETVRLHGARDDRAALPVRRLLPGRRLLEDRRHIIPKIQRAGGEVFTYAHVEEILARRWRSAPASDGRRPRDRCPVVISSAGVDNTFRRLLPARDCTGLGYIELRCGPCGRASATCASTSVCRDTAEELGLPKTNFWIYPHNDYDGARGGFLATDPEAPFPVVYISFPSAKDPRLPQPPPRHGDDRNRRACALSEWFEKWRGTTWGKRGEDYEAFKATARRAADAAALRQAAAGRRAGSTTTSCRRRCRRSGSPRTGTANCTGWITRRSGCSRTGSRPRTRIPGLWLTGQDTLTCGVTGAMMAGLLTVTAMVGMRRMTPLMKRIYA